MENNVLNLYLVKCRGMKYSNPNYGISYVVAHTTDEAYQKVLEYLKDKDIGFSSDRVLESVTLVAESGKPYPGCGTFLFL